MIYQIDPINTPGKDDVAYWEDFLTKDEINRLLASQEWLQNNVAEIGLNNGSVVPEIRRTSVGWLYPTTENKDIWDKLITAINQVNSKFFQFDLTGCYEPAQLGIYMSTSADHYDWHTDTNLGSSGTPRKLTMCLMLSDTNEFEGGDLQIMKSSKIETLELKQGRAWFFPSWMLHRVTPVTKGIRRSLVLWVGGPAFK